MKEEVLKQIEEKINYLKKIKELQQFWRSNSHHLPQIIAHYFSFENPQIYFQNPDYHNNFVQNVLEIEVQQTHEKLETLHTELQEIIPTEQYIALLNKQLFLSNQFQLLDNYLTKLNDYNKKIDIQKLISDGDISSTDQSIQSTFITSAGNIKSNVETLSNALAVIENLDLLKDKNENLVLIGANGSGKSTFSRQIKKSLDTQASSFVAVIPAQKTFGFDETRSYIPLKSNAHKEFNRSHTDNKLLKNNNDEFRQMIDYLIAEHHEVANHTHAHSETLGFTKEKSIMENVIQIWESLITHLRLQYNGKGNIRVKPENGQEYNFMYLSDGEKNIFFCVASVLLVEKNGYVIVDEPENHLNMAIVNKLWDSLEDRRDDCQFVYLTHNPSFAMGRAGAKIFWVKKYTPPANWERHEIPADNVLSSELMVELIGSKKNILFCEGQKGSLDYQLYSILFPNYTIIPSGGHRKVMEYCEAFNNNSEISSIRAIAIIDKDFHDADQITVWRKKNIYTLDVIEVENILCDETILKHVQAKTYIPDDDFARAQKKLFTHIEKYKENQAMEYIKSKTAREIEIPTDKHDEPAGKYTTPKKFKEELIRSIEQLDTEKFYNERIQLLESICKERDYEKALKHYKKKEMLQFVGNQILKDYGTKVIKFIRANTELQQTIRDKHFKDIPLE